jgi:hypothetical protein
MDHKKEKEINDVIQYFNRQVSNIFKVIDTKDDSIQNNPDVDWLRRITKIIRNENPPYMLEKSVDKLWDNRIAILAKDADFLVKKELVSKYIKNDERKEWMEGLMSFIRSKYLILNPTELDYLWNCINAMLQSVIKFRILKDDYNK